MTSRTLPDRFEAFCRTGLLLLTILVPLAAFGPSEGSATEPGSEWPRWRGPRTDGAAVGSRALDTREGGSPGLAVAWRKALGSGYSSVSIADGRAVTMFGDGRSDFAVAFDAKTGRELWRYRIAEMYRGHDGSHDGPMSTPALAEGRVFGLGPRGHLFALDAATGEELWRTHLKHDHGGVEPLYGFATSPLLVDGVLVVELGREEGTALAGFDPATGERRWTAGSDAVSYQSPALFRVGGRDQVLAVGDERLFGLDPRGGEVLWEHPHGGESTIGALTLNPVPAGQGRVFLGHKEDQTLMLRVRPGGDGTWSVDELWTSRYLRNTYSVPVYYEGYLYGYTSRFFTCVDAATGEPAWRSREPGDGFVIRIDDHLVIVTKTGGLHLAEATPEEYREMTSLDLFEHLAWTPASFAGGRIYARSFGEIVAVDLGVQRRDPFSAQKRVE